MKYEALVKLDDSLWTYDVPAVPIVRKGFEPHLQDSTCKSVNFHFRRDYE